nr:MAG TPA: hypothetical protein [Caudoviricetes sp.]
MKRKMLFESNTLPEMQGVFHITSMSQYKLVY